PPAPHSFPTRRSSDLSAAGRRVSRRNRCARLDGQPGQGGIAPSGTLDAMLDLIRQLVVANTTKIVLLSLDGLGGLPRPETGRSELETARIPNLTALATEAACGLLRHVAPGITPGSGPGHLGLFGYDPLRFQVGRGVLESLGIQFDLRAGDVAARGNFCSVDAP